MRAFDPKFEVISCFRISTPTLSLHVLTNYALALVYLETPSSLRSMLFWLSFSLRYIASLYEHHNEEEYNSEQCALKNLHITVSE